MTVSVERHNKVKDKQKLTLGRLADAAFNAIFSGFSSKERQIDTTVSETSPTEETLLPSSEECRPDFFNVGDSCFFVSRNLMARNWVEAQLECMEMNSTLASITNMEELQSIQTNCSYIGRFFIGGTDSGSENNWKWSDGAEWEFENWRSGEPNGGGRENCMEMEASGLGLWNDIDCSGFAGRCNFGGHTACNLRPSAQPKRYVCGYSLRRQPGAPGAPGEENEDCGIWTVKDVENLAAEEEAAFSLPFIPVFGRENVEGREKPRRRRKENI